MGEYVFVIDDDPAVMRLATIILKIDGYRVDAFQSPLAALERLSNEPGPEPDLILLDLNMPEMTGREFFIQARNAGFARPIVIVSAYGAESARRELGADGALRKPFTPEDLSRIVASVARESESA
jgi:CheY-like chemotaxis protein